MSTSTYYDSTSVFASEILPITHVYMPTTFSQVLSKYFKDNHDENECLIWGQWEIRPGKPGGKGSKRLGSGSDVAIEEGLRSGVVTRRQSASRVKELGCSSSSRNHAGGCCAGVESGAGDGDYRRAVICVNIVGVTAMFRGDDGEGARNLQRVGIVTRRGGVPNRIEERKDLKGGIASPVLWCFQLDPEDERLSIQGAYWRDQYYHSCSNRVIQFCYDPVEFQQWEIPESYPLGLPQVFLNGLKFHVQKNVNDLQETSDFTPAFPSIHFDHQDLQACSKLPSTSVIGTNPVIRFISTRSSGLQQIIYKVSILAGAFVRTYPVLPVLNFLFLLVVDSIIGYLITRYLLQLPNMMGLLHTTVDQMLAKLNHLLKWLRGAPAGLKLNPNLNSLYWRFFSYHIHLWANYIGILEPVFAVILYTIQYFGVLGATIQISLLKDLLSLATFHVYCLYIYASRLYSLQTTAIKALCRVFFGRKYNPLRNRIDSVQLTTPELFLSSFGFVILIFLLPTTMVYYTGFVFLRVPVLIIERLLQYLVITYNELPFISWLMIYFKSPRVADEIYLVPVKKSRTQSSTSSTDKQLLNVCGGSITAFHISLQSTRTLFSLPNLGGGIKSIVSSVIDGTVLKD